MRDQKLGKNDIIYIVIAFLIVIYFLISNPITTGNTKDMPEKKIKTYHVVLDNGTEVTLYNYGSRDISSVPIKEIGITVFILLAIFIYMIREVSLRRR